MTKTQIIGFVGYANSGKSTISKHFEENYNSNIISFSEPIYQMLHQIGIYQWQIDDKNEREMPREILDGKSIIDCLISLGTVWGRGMVHDELWINIALKKIIENRLNIFENVRFFNEAEAIKKLSGKLIYINNTKLEDIKIERESEKHISLLRTQCDLEVDNDMSDNSASRMSNLIIDAIK